MREVVAEFERPVMLYSIGKDSSVLLRLAQKAFYPGPIPFPLLHIDTTYKFREMIEFRDWYADGDRRAADRPHQRGGDRRRHAAVPRRHAALLRAAEDEVAARRARGRQLRRGVRRRAARRGALARQGAHLLAARRQGPVGSEAPAARAVEPAERPHPARREHPRVSAVELDRARRLAATSRSRTFPIVPLYFAKEREVVVRGNSLHHARAAVRAAAAGRAAADGPVPHALARLLAVHRRRPLGRRHGAEDHRGADRRPSTPSASCASSITIRTGRWS